MESHVKKNELEIETGDNVVHFVSGVPEQYHDLLTHSAYIVSRLTPFFFVQVQHE
jgi:hypothetical protein